MGIKLTSEPTKPGDPPHFPIAGVLCMIAGGFLLYKAGFGFGIPLLILGFVWLVIALIIKFRHKPHATG